jgi:hypothetical protein
MRLRDLHKMYKWLVFIFIWNFILNLLAWLAWYAYYFNDFRNSMIP